jgi:hypothetical protein
MHARKQRNRHRTDEPPPKVLSDNVPVEVDAIEALVGAALEGVGARGAAAAGGGSSAESAGERARAEAAAVAASQGQQPAFAAAA